MVRVLVTFCLTLMLCNCSSISTKESDIFIGVLAIRGPDKALARWSPTVAYLQKNLPQHNFTLIPLDLTQMRNAVIHDELNFVLTNTGHYYELRQYGLEPITSLKNLRNGKPYSQFGAVIFTRADRVDISSIDDLKGNTFAAVSKQAFGGFQMAWREFVGNSIDPFVDFTGLVFTGFPQDEVVNAVLNGTVDSGTVRTDVIEKMEREGRIDSADIKIINAYNNVGFPFRLSTRLYPEWPFLRAQRTSKGLANRVRNLLVAITPDSTTAKSGHYYGWSNEDEVGELFDFSLAELLSTAIGSHPDNVAKYRSIDALMQELKIGPYQTNQR